MNDLICPYYLMESFELHLKSQLNCQKFDESICPCTPFSGSHCHTEIPKYPVSSRLIEAGMRMNPSRASSTDIICQRLADHVCQIMHDDVTVLQITTTAGVPYERSEYLAPDPITKQSYLLQHSSLLTITCTS